MRQLVSTLGRFSNNGRQHQQCAIPKSTKFGQAQPEKHKIYVTPVHTTPQPTTIKNLEADVIDERKVMTNLLLGKDQQNKASIRMASDIAENIHNANKFKVEESVPQQKNSDAEEKVIEDQECTCLPTDECPTDKIDYRFGESCKIGKVRCCSLPTKTKDIVNGVDLMETPVTTFTATTSTSTASSAELETTVDITQTLFKEPLTTNDQISGKNVDFSDNKRMLNHQSSGQNVQSAIKGQDLTPYQRHTIPSKSSYFHLIPTR